MTGTIREAVLVILIVVGIVIGYMLGYEGGKSDWMIKCGGEEINNECPIQELCICDPCPTDTTEARP